MTPMCSSDISSALLHKMVLALEFCWQDLLSLMNHWSTLSWKYVQIVLLVGHDYMFEVRRMDDGNGLTLDDSNSYLQRLN